MMHRAHKTRLYVNNKQGSLLLQCCGASRFAYNTCLAKWNDDYASDDQVRHNRFSIKKWFNHWKVENAPWTYSYSKWIYEAAIQDLASGFDRFFKGQCGHPKFHKRGTRESFRIDGSVVKLDGKSLRLPKGITLKMAEQLRFDISKIYNVTVSLEAGKWYVSINCEVLDRPRESQSGAVGIDMGLKELATLSDGYVVDNPRCYKKMERRLAHLQRKLARQKKYSNNYKKTKLRIARLHKRIADKRKDHHHKATTAIAGKYGVVFLEDLNVVGMAKNRSLAKAVQDAGMSLFVEQLGYKTKAVKIDRWYPSSKTCSCCGHVKPMPLNLRIYECPSCGMVMDRDMNAAVNILNVGMANYSELMPVEGDNHRTRSLGEAFDEAGIQRQFLRRIA